MKQAAENKKTQGLKPEGNTSSIFDLTKDEKEGQRESKISKVSKNSKMT